MSSSLRALLAAQQVDLEKGRLAYDEYCKDDPTGRWAGYWGLWCRDGKHYRDLYIVQDGRDIRGEWSEDGHIYVLQGTLTDSLMTLEGASVYDKESGKFQNPVSIRMGTGYHSLTLSYDWYYLYPNGRFPRKLCKARPQIAVLYSTDMPGLEKAVAGRLADLYRGNAFAEPERETDHASIVQLYLKGEVLCYEKQNETGVHGATVSIFTSAITRESVENIVEIGKVAVVAVPFTDQVHQIMNQRLLVRFINLHVQERGDNAGPLATMHTKGCEVTDMFVDNPEQTAIRVAESFGIKM